jgi:hypothetical protein
VAQISLEIGQLITKRLNLRLKQIDQLFAYYTHSIIPPGTVLRDKKMGQRPTSKSTTTAQSVILPGIRVSSSGTAGK